MELYSSKGSISYHQPRILYPVKLSFKREGEIEASQANNK